MRARPVVMIAARDPSLADGGHPNYVIAHALAAAAAGFSPQLFCASARSELVATEFGTLHRVATPFHRGYRNERVQRPFFARAVMRYVAQLEDPGPHILHSFGACAPTGVQAARMLAARGVAAIPIVNAYTTLAHENRAKVKALSGHHDLAVQWRYRGNYLWVRAVAGPAEHRGYRESAIVLVNYESVRQLILEACDPPPPLRLVPYAAPAAFHDTTRLRTRGPGSLPLIVNVARQDPRKGIDVLIHALAGLAQARIPFRAVLVGAGPLLAAHRRLVAELGLGADVELPGFVDDVFTHLDPAGIFVLPSLEEGSGSVALLEALQAGTAVIASRCDGIPEDLRDGTDALLVEPGNAEALTRALSLLLEDSQLRDRLAARARAVFEERFSAQRFAHALGNAYAELLSA